MTPRWPDRRPAQSRGRARCRGFWTGAIASAVTLAVAGAPGAPSAGALACASAQATGPEATPARAEGSSTVVVASAAQLRAAVAAARPGDQILIAPGRYRTRIRFDPRNSGSAERPVVVRARDGLGSVVIDAVGSSITIKFSGAAHVEIRDLEITGGGHHGVFFDRGAHHITIRHNRIYDNHGIRPLDSHAELKGSGGQGRPADIAIVGNEIFHRMHPPGGNFQGIDCNFCERFRIEGNYLHDINSPTAEPYSHYDRGACIQMKSASRDTVIAGNRIARCHIGIVYGGEGLASPAHRGGVIQNNLIHDSAEMAIAIVDVRDGRVYQNTLFRNGQSIRIVPDQRHPSRTSDVEVANNLLDHAITGFRGAGVSSGNNLVLPAAAAADVFIDPKARDFRLRPSARSVIDRGADLGGAVACDHEGTPRPQGSGYDIGAFEYRPGTLE
jgi:Periplasmic copper-binding protein (NosD)